MEGNKDTMTLIGRVTVGSPLIHDTLKRVPGMKLHLEDIRQGPEDSRRFVVRAVGDDFEAFDAALATDSTVGDYRCLTELQDERLYRVTLSEEGQRESVYSVIAEQDIVLIETTITTEGIHSLVHYPSRETLAAFHNACRDQEISFRLEHLYSEETTANDGGPDSRFGVTEAQQEALLQALKTGYFGIPRQTKLETIAEELDISTSALSTRLRRGQQNLIRYTIVHGSST